MIVVVEGISAAGKTTYARAFGEQHWLSEFPEQGTVPGADAPAEVHAAYWLEHNIRRFLAALEIEEKYGFTICDTDPFKSHFDWCMARAGFKPMDLFNHAMPMAREAIAERKLGFANLYLVKRIEPEVARAQKEGDFTRSRHRFEMHLALQTHLMEWFTALSEALPGRVLFEWPEKEVLLSQINSKAPEDDPRRFDVSVLDNQLRRLPK